MSVTIDDEDRVELEALDAEVDREVARAGPSCALSGRCCRFAEHGHTLFVTSVEIRRMLADAPAPLGPLDDGQTCPWQDEAGRCTARDARPLGCRIYFCDPLYRDRMEELTEAALRRLKGWVRARGLEWDYRPLHAHLAMAQQEGYGFPEVRLPSTHQNIGIGDGTRSPSASDERSGPDQVSVVQP